MWARDRAWGDAANASGYEDFIIKLIKTGSDLHVIRHRSTVLLRVIRVSLVLPQSVLRAKMSDWLHLLVRAGIDFFEFGQIENHLRDHNNVTWNMTTAMQPGHVCRNYSCFEILKIEFGATPEDFYIEFEDVYVPSSLSALFWQLVEDASIEDTVERSIMPGAWCDDEVFQVDEEIWLQWKGAAGQVRALIAWALISKLPRVIMWGNA